MTNRKERTPTAIADSSEAGTGGVAEIAKMICADRGVHPMTLYQTSVYQPPEGMTYPEDSHFVDGRGERQSMHYAYRRYERVAKAIAALSAPVGEPVAWIEPAELERLRKAKVPGLYRICPTNMVVGGTAFYTNAAPTVGTEEVARAIVMLRAASRLIMSDGHAQEATIEHDDTTCDGLCIAEECETAAEALSLLSGQGAQNNSINPINHEQSK